VYDETAQRGWNVAGRRPGVGSEVGVPSDIYTVSRRSVPPSSSIMPSQTTTKHIKQGLEDF
jgi:hypothetical protein